MGKVRVKVIVYSVENLHGNKEVKVEYCDSRFYAVPGRYLDSLSVRGFKDHLIESPLDDMMELIKEAKEP